MTVTGNYETQGTPGNSHLHTGLLKLFTGVKKLKRGYFAKRNYVDNLWSTSFLIVWKTDGVLSL